MRQRGNDLTIALDLDKMSRIISNERIKMREWVTSRGIVRCTKEIELLCWVHANGRRVWKLDISAYGQWWCESYDRKLDAYRMLRDRWGVSWAFWRELCRDARVVEE